MGHAQQAGRHELEHQHEHDQHQHDQRQHDHQHESGQGRGQGQRQGETVPARRGRRCPGRAPTSALLLCGLLGWTIAGWGGPARAISPEAGQPPTARLPGLAAARPEPADPLYFVTISDGVRAFSDTQALRPLEGDPRVVLSTFRHRRIKVIHYTAPLRSAQNDMVLNFDAPGAGRAIVSVELEF